MSSSSELYTLSLHDALPIYFAAGDPGISGSHLAAAAADAGMHGGGLGDRRSYRREHRGLCPQRGGIAADIGRDRSEEHTSELQSLRHLVCRLLLYTKK